jgi:hypothetical protein
MDDVVVDISTQNNKQLRLAIQLKQKEKKHKKLSPGSFEAQTGNFSLKKYCQAFKNLFCTRTPTLIPIEKTK